MCFLKCTLQEGVPEFPLYNIKGKHGEMDADMDADAAFALAETRGGIELIVRETLTEGASRLERAGSR